MNCHMMQLQFSIMEIDCLWVSFERVSGTTFSVEKMAVPPLDQKHQPDEISLQRLTVVMDIVSSAAPLTAPKITALSPEISMHW